MCGSFVDFWQLYLKWYVALIGCTLIYYCVKIYGLPIELSIEHITNWYVFYILSFVGIYVCLYIAKAFEKSKILSRLFAFIGLYSFDIMALHFVVLKIVDLIYGKYFIAANEQTISKFPYAFTELWWLYAILGTTIPAVLGWMVTSIKKHIRKIVQPRAPGDEENKMQNQ